MNRTPMLPERALAIAVDRSRFSPETITEDSFSHGPPMTPDAPREETRDTLSITEVASACARLHRFANAHRLVFSEKGECGFGRPCVGLLGIGGNYLSHNPMTATDFHRIPEFEDDRFYPPDAIAPDAYHKHDCFAVLVHDDKYDAAILQLAAWLDYIEAIGPVEVVSFETGATGLQALFSGVRDYAIRFVKPAAA